MFWGFQLNFLNSQIKNLVMKLEDKYFDILFYVVRAIDYHISSNMRAIYYFIDEDDLIIRVLLCESPSQKDDFLISDICGLLFGDNLFQNVKSEVIIDSVTPLYKLTIDGFRVFSRNEDEEYGFY